MFGMSLIGGGTMRKKERKEVVLMEIMKIKYCLKIKIKINKRLITWNYWQTIAWNETTDELWLWIKWSIGRS